MRLVYELIMLGYLVISKIINRILMEFYWFGMKLEIKRFCCLCDIC